MLYNTECYKGIDQVQPMAHIGHTKTTSSRICIHNRFIQDSFRIHGVYVKLCVKGNAMACSPSLHSQRRDYFYGFQTSSLSNMLNAMTQLALRGENTNNYISSVSRTE